MQSMVTLYPTLPCFPKGAEVRMADGLRGDIVGFMSNFTNWGYD